MRAFAGAAIGLILSGCASVAANETGGLVDNVWTASTAMAKAGAECGRYGRTAKARNYDALGGSLTFECVTR